MNVFMALIHKSNLNIGLMITAGLLPALAMFVLVFHFCLSRLSSRQVYDSGRKGMRESRPGNGRHDLKESPGGIIKNLRSHG